MAVLSRTAPNRNAERLKAARKRRKPNRSAQVGRWVSYGVLTAGAVVFVGPWAWMVIASFKDIGEIFQYPPSWWTSNPTIQSYKDFLADRERRALVPEQRVHRGLGHVPQPGLLVDGRLLLSPSGDSPAAICCS